MQITHVLSANISQFHRVVYIYSDVVPPIHVVSYHVATDKPPPKMATSSGLFLEQSIATRGKKARDTLLVDKHCGNGCSIKRAPLSVSYYNEISGGHIGRAVVWRRCSADPVLPLWSILLEESLTVAEKVGPILRGCASILVAHSWLLSLISIN